MILESTYHENLMATCNCNTYAQARVEVPVLIKWDLTLLDKFPILVDQKELHGENGLHLPLG